MKTPVRFLRKGPVGLPALLVMFAFGCGSSSGQTSNTPTIEISPHEASLPPGGSKTFLAVGAPASSVSWAVSGGSITSAGVYTAPTQTGSYQVQATYGGVTGYATVAVFAAGSPASLYAGAQATCAGFPLRSTGTVHYFCDCQTGAQAGCVAGSDSNNGTSPSTPKQTLAAATTAFGAMSAGDSIAFCQGGSWTTSVWNTWSNSHCAAGSSIKDPANGSTCDIRDYVPSWGGGGVRPLLHQAANNYLFFFSSTSGVRILNLNLTGAAYSSNQASWGSMAAIAFQDSTSSDYLVCNNYFDSWYLSFNTSMVLGAGPARWTIWGNKFTHNGLDAYLGEVSGLTIDSNYFDNIGDNGNSFFNHVIYVGAADVPVTNVSIVNNEFHRSEGASGGTPGSMIVMHGQVTGPTLIQNNVIDAGPNPTIYAMGIAPANGGYGKNEWFRNVTIRGNWLTGFPGGNGSIITDCATNMLVENNVVVQTQGGYAINTPYQACPLGDASANITVRNNTVYYPSGQSGTGIAVENEGTGHVLANNSVYFTTSGGTCFSTGLASSAYSFVGNSACYGGTWGTSYDATMHITANPLYTNAPVDFTPATGSPLTGAGSATWAAVTDFAAKTRPNPPSIGAFEP